MIVEAAIAIAGVATLVGYLVGYATGRCSKDNPCAKCSYHVNEQRVARMEAERLRVEEQERQIVLRHDMEHKGAGALPRDPDKFSCSDETCARNPKRVDSGTGGR